MSCEISKELADFFNLNCSQSQNNEKRISRVKITKLIDDYIETNRLRDNRTIKPDEKLKKLLNCGDNEVTFANLQSYITPHIISMKTMETTKTNAAIFNPPSPSAPPLSPPSVYAIFPEDEELEPPIPLLQSVYAIFPEDDIDDETSEKSISQQQGAVASGGFEYFH